MPDWFPKQTIGDLLNQATERFGPREALMYEGRRWTFNEFRAEVDKVARALINLGVQPGDKVSLWMPNRAEWLFLFGAVAKIGAVLVPGGRAPKLVARDDLASMRPGSVIVDVAIDQGGCCETSRPTTHAEPTYTVNDVVHYCVANMPGGVPRTSTFALNNVTLPFALELADLGAREALMSNPHLRNGLNVHAGKVTYKPVAEELGYDYVPADEALFQ